jgi:flavin reductase (DIM6/NTAB) family NADH-FMN oxidoreductase RutF
MVKITPAELPAGKSLYALLISAVTPRPIAFVSTQSAAGVTNLAPFSFFGMMCHDPPTRVFCTTHRSGDRPEKDTLANIRETSECVVNMISEDLVEAANCCCGEYPADVDEFLLSGLTKVPSELPLNTPRVGEAKVQMEGKVVVEEY